MRFLNLPSALAVVLTSGVAAQAATVDVFLIADQTAPTFDASGSFSFTTSSVFKLGLDGDNKVASQEKVDDFKVTIGPSLTYNSHTGDFNQNAIEGPDAQSKARADSEIASWDDVGFYEDNTTDAPLNIDYGSSAKIEYNEISGGFFDLIIAEDGGLDPFKLSLCDDDDCSSLTTIFDGFTDTLRDTFLAMDAFSALDTTNVDEMDQAFLFRFSENVTDHLRIDYNGEFSTGTGRGRTKLEIDFAGVAGISPVPLPAGLVLLLSSFGMFGALRTRKSRLA